MDLILAFPPTVPGGSPANIVSSAISFFQTWISRAGGLVAFVGAIKLALAVRSEDEKEIMTGALTMVSGFMICEAVSSMELFKVTSTNPVTAFSKITAFIKKWGLRVGGIGMLIGTIQFGLGIKDNNAASKVIALKGMVAGAMVGGVSSILYLFI